MAAQVFPSLRGLAFNISRTPMWNNNLQESVSGKVTACARWTYPRYEWNLVYEFLRGAPAYAEFQSLLGFFNSRYGNFDPFLFEDIDDNTAAAQQLGIGDGSTTTFQLVRTFGGFVEPVFAPNVVSSVKINGVTQDPSAYSVADYNSDTPGVITFVTPPTTGQVITADFTFYFPCRFTDQSLDFNKFLHQLWEGKSVKIRSQK